MSNEYQKQYNKERREKYKNDPEFRKLEKIRKKLWYEENRERILNRLAEQRKNENIDTENSINIE